MKIEELKIPAPWGHIAVKSWNDPAYETVIVSHGFMDNAGAFDRIIPLLPKIFHYACLDLPGHGFSSHFHQSRPIHFLDYLLAYKRVVEHFGKERYILLGHSLGGQCGFFFAQSYPELVSKVISLDALVPVPLSAELYVSHIRKAHEVYLAVNKRSQVYAYNEAVDKIKNTRLFGTLTEETAADLLRRMGGKTADGKYVFTSDRRTPIMPAATHEFNVELFNNVPLTCPVLIVLVRDNEYTRANYKLREHLENIGFNVRFIDGDHHVHQTAPEETARIVREFLLHSSKY